MQAYHYVGDKIYLCKTMLVDSVKTFRQQGKTEMVVRMLRKYFHSIQNSQVRSQLNAFLKEQNVHFHSKEINLKVLSRFTE